MWMPGAGIWFIWCFNKFCYHSAWIVKTPAGRCTNPAGKCNSSQHPAATMTEIKKWNITCNLYLIGYNPDMIEIRKTDEYARWFLCLRDNRAKARINIRIRRLSLGNPGDVKPVGGGVSELRIDVGKGYRVYFVRQGSCVIVLLVGGDKSTQKKDTKKARELAKQL